MDSDRIEGAVKTFGGKVEGAVGRAVGDDDMRASGIAREMEGKGQNIYGQAKDGLRDAGERVERAARVTGHLADQVLDEGERHVANATSLVGRKVAEQPLTSLLVAAAFGFIAGVVVRRI